MSTQAETAGAHGGAAAADALLELGLASDYADILRFHDFAAHFVDLTDAPADFPPRIAC